MPTQKEETKLILDQLIKSCNDTKKKLIAYKIYKSKLNPETIRDKKEIELDQNFANDFLHSIDFFISISQPNKDHLKECICALNLNECDKQCKF